MINIFSKISFAGVIISKNSNTEMVKNMFSMSRQMYQPVLPFKSVQDRPGSL